MGYFYKHARKEQKKGRMETSPPLQRCFYCCARNTCNKKGRQERKEYLDAVVGFVAQAQKP